MKKTILTSLLCAGAVSLNAQQTIPQSDPFQSGVEGDPYQNVFATPVHAPNADKAWGEPAIAWHNGEYFLIYDNFNIKGAPACLMTSKDGVYWKEEGAILYPDPDHNGCIECPDLRKFTPDGPFVLSYDAKLKDRNYHVRRFAVSNDLRHWKKIDRVEFGADERYYKQAPFYNQYSIANPDGGWFAVLNAAPKDFMGLGLARSQDGIHWECLPPLRVTGVVDQQGGNAGPGCKALELSAVLKLKGRYFILGGNPLSGADIILTSRDIVGPYEPTPKNSIQMRTPQIFQRMYDLPGGYLSMPMLWAQRDRKYYHVAPFRSVVSDGESLWFKWWAGNERLKVHPLAVSLRADPDPNASVRMINERFDFAKGLVLEATVELPSPSAPATNWARTAKASASSTQSQPWWPSGYFAPGRAVDNRQTTAWRGSAAKENEPVNFDLDLGASRPIGSIQIKWLVPPAKSAIKYSADGESWSALPALPRGVSVSLENLNVSARFLRVENTLGSGPKSRVGISEIVVSSEPFERLPKEAGGLFLETQPGEGWAWLIERNGCVRFGKVSGNGTRFESLKERDLEVALGDHAAIRLVQRDDIVDLYVNDYQVDYYQLQGEPLSGRLGLYSPADAAPKAWMPDPNYKEGSAIAKPKK